MGRKTLRQKLYEQGLKQDKKLGLGKKYAMEDRPEGSRWHGTPIQKVDILRFAKQATRSDGTIDKEKFANLIAGFPGGAKGGYDVLRKISFQKGQTSETESKGAGKARRPKRRGNDTRT